MGVKEIFLVMFGMLLSIIITELTQTEERPVYETGKIVDSLQGKVYTLEEYIEDFKTEVDTVLSKNYSHIDSLRNALLECTLINMVADGTIHNMQHKIDSLCQVEKTVE